MDNLSQMMIRASVWVIPVIIAITLHEAAHGYAALKFGDRTAQMMGRVSLNPFRHVDPFGTVLLPAVLLLSGTSFLFGYAKPVPVNFGNLRHPKRDMIWVAAAGPAMNMLLAAISAVLIPAVIHLPTFVSQWAVLNLINLVQLNLILAVFNLLPIPPLDGGRILVGLLPRRAAWKLQSLERYGIVIVLVAVFLLPILGQRLGINLDVFSWLIGEPVRFLSRILLGAVGV